jgi:hypothetical protein
VEAEDSTTGDGGDNGVESGLSQIMGKDLSALL